MRSFNVKQRAVAAVAVAAALMGGLVSNANAALDSSVSTAFTAVQTDAVALSAIVVPIVVAILGLVITIKLIKRFGSKI